MNKELDIYTMVGRLSYADNDGDDVTIKQCIRGVERLGVTWAELQLPCRERRIVDARRLCCLLLREKGWTFLRIAETVGYSNHATAIHHVNTATQLLEYDSGFRNKHLTFTQA